MKKAAELVLVITLMLPFPAFSAELVPSIILGGVTDSGQTDELYAGVGVLYRGSVWGNVSAEINGFYAEYPAHYTVIPFGSTPGSTLIGFAVDEQRTDYSALLSYPLMVQGLRFSVVAGFHGSYMDNSVTSFDMSGPTAGAEVGGSVHETKVELRAMITEITSLSVKNHITSVHHIVGTRTIAIEGDPTSLFDYRVAVWRGQGNGHRIGLGIEGEVLHFQRNERYYYGLAGYYAF